jgi:predicted transposase YdaD
VKFIEWVIRFSKSLEKRLKKEIKKIEEEFKMPYLTSWERSAKKKGMEEKAIETARNLLEMGIEIDKIAKATGLKKEKVEKMAAIAHRSEFN